MPQISSEIPKEKDEEAKKIHGRRGWPRGHTHPPEVAAPTHSPEASLIHGGSVLHWPGRQGLSDGSSSGSSRPGSSPAAGRPLTKIRPDWSPFPSPSSSPSSLAPKPPSSPSPLSSAKRARSSGARVEASAAEKSGEDRGGMKAHCSKNPVRRVI